MCQICRMGRPATLDDERKSAFDQRMVRCMRSSTT